MLVIRLTRTGRKNLATYRVVAAEKARAAKGKYIANLGHYNPHTKELKLDKAAIAKYLENGAQPSSAVVKLFKQAKIKMPEWAEANLVVRKRPPKNQEETEETEDKKEAQSGTEETPPESTAAESAEKAEEPKEEVKSEETQEEPKEEKKDSAKSDDKAEAKKDPSEEE